MFFKCLLKGNSQQFIFLSRERGGEEAGYSIVSYEIALCTFGDVLSLGEINAYPVHSVQEKQTNETKWTLRHSKNLIEAQVKKKKEQSKKQRQR